MTCRLTDLRLPERIIEGERKHGSYLASGGVAICRSLGSYKALVHGCTLIVMVDRCELAG